MYQQYYALGATGSAAASDGRTSSQLHGGAAGTTPEDKGEALNIIVKMMRVHHEGTVEIHGPSRNHC